MSLRGFDTNSVGAKNQQSKLNTVASPDSLGGDTKTSFLALLSVPVPIEALAKASMRAFWFVNVGSLGNSNYWRMKFGDNREFQGKSTPVFGYLRGSIGSGFSISLQNVLRLELTYSMPFLSSPSDQTKKGFQLGFGMSIN
jgi:outer membrane protein assembly factor BamA